MQDELMLLKRIDAGDASALRELYDLYYVRLARFLARITGDRELAAEAINDVFMVIWRDAGKFRGASRVSTWILGIAYRKGLKACRTKKHTSQLDGTEETGENSLYQELLSRETSKLLQKLSPEHRAVIELTYYFGYSYKEIGELLECPENTVKTRMFYARRILKGLLEGSEID